MRTNPAWALAVVLCALSLMPAVVRAETPPPAPPAAPASPAGPKAEPAPAQTEVPSGGKSEVLPSGNSGPHLDPYQVKDGPSNSWRNALLLADPEQSNKTMAELGIVPASGSKLPQVPPGWCIPKHGPFWTSYTGPGCTKEQTDGPTPLAIILAALAVMVMATVPAVVVLKRKRKAETQSRPTLPTKPRE